MIRVRDILRDVVPWWLSDRHFSSGKDVGFRLLWAIVAPLDGYLEMLHESLEAAWPGVGTPSALPLIGRTRGILRGEAETSDEYAARLRGWLDAWRDAGSQKAIARELHGYLAGHPRVRVVNRAGHMVTIGADGTVTAEQVAWDWDSVSNPERHGDWSDLWVIVYRTPAWALEASWGSGGTWGAGDGGGLGHAVPRASVDAVKGILGQWKAAHTRVRAVVWTSDAALFDPANPSSMPDGNWGQWSSPSRNYTSCRYWEP